MKVLNGSGGYNTPRSSISLIGAYCIRPIKLIHPRFNYLLIDNPTIVSGVLLNNAFSMAFMPSVYTTF